jgi:hypothetical protein
LEQWPFLKPWYKRFAGEVVGMKQEWILFSILALAVSTITWWILPRVSGEHNMFGWQVKTATTNGVFRPKKP